MPKPLHVTHVTLECPPDVLLSYLPKRVMTPAAPFVEVTQPEFNRVRLRGARMGWRTSRFVDLHVQSQRGSPDSVVKISVFDAKEPWQLKPATLLAMMVALPLMSFGSQVSERDPEALVAAARRGLERCVSDARAEV